MKFFNSLYFNLYTLSRKKNAAPEVPVLGFISFCQTNNILSLLNLLFYILNFNTDYKIHYYYLVIQLLIYVANYLYYEKNDNGALVLKGENVRVLNIYIPYLYIISSAFITGFTYYILKEF